MRLGFGAAGVQQWGVKQLGVGLAAMPQLHVPCMQCMATVFNGSPRCCPCLLACCPAAACLPACPPARLLACLPLPACACRA